MRGDALTIYGKVAVMRWLGGGGRQACGRCNRTAVTYDTLRKECLETIRQWPGYETIAGIQLISDNSPAGFSAKVTLCGRADKKVATAL